MTVRTRILEAAAELLASSADADISTRDVCDAAGVTAPTLYHHFDDKEGLLTAVVDFGWAAFLDSKRTVAAVIHQHVADDIRAGWDNHLQFARENPNFYKLMWSPAIAATGVAFREAFQMLYDRLDVGATRGQLQVSVDLAAQTVMAAVTGAALAVISQPDLFGALTFTTQLREAVISSITVPPERLAKRGRHARATRPLSVAISASTLNSLLEVEDTALTAPERALMQQWLTMLTDPPRLHR
jgi:AcrR family transcriptional regulator